MRFYVLVILLVISLRSDTSTAGIQTFDDQAAWESAVAQLGTFSTITFTELPDNTFVTDQYLDDFGVNFTGPPAQVGGPACSTYHEDCFGLDAFPATPEGIITLEFNDPQRWIAAHYPGDIVFELYQDDRLIDIVGGFPGGGSGFFGGLISDTWFDRVVIDDPWFGVEIDNLYFGGPVPAPSALILISIGATFTRRRRRIA